MHLSILYCHRQQEREISENVFFVHLTGFSIEWASCIVDHSMRPREALGSWRTCESEMLLKSERILKRLAHDNGSFN